MTLDEGLYQYLTGQAGLMALVSTRIYPDVLPQDVKLPAVAFLVLEEQFDPTHDTDGIQSTRYVFVIEGETAKSVGAVSAELEKALHRYRGTWDGIAVLGILKAGGRREYEPAVGQFSKEQGYTVYHRKAAETSPA